MNDGGLSWFVWQFLKFENHYSVLKAPLSTVDSEG
jgi:hypothetical protein